MFTLSADPIEPAALALSLKHSGAGAVVSFEGCVRDHNGGRAVASLEYEACAELALKEGNRILREARKQFNVLSVRCVHRAGHLQLQDTAVWVGVSAVHRAAAFACCCYIIEEIKKELPIWKKEHYADGEAEWLRPGPPGA